MVPSGTFFLNESWALSNVNQGDGNNEAGSGGCLAGEGLTLLLWEGCLPPASLRRGGGEGAAGGPTLSRPPQSSAKRGRGQGGAGPCRVLGLVPAALSGLPRLGARPRVPRHPLLQVGGCPPPARC